LPLHCSLCRRARVYSPELRRWLISAAHVNDGRLRLDQTGLAAHSTLVHGNDQEVGVTA